MVKKHKVESISVTKGEGHPGLVEPDGCIIIPTHAEEKEEIKKTNIKPSYLVNYLMYAENYAKAHFTQEKIKKLQHYHFKEADFTSIIKTEDKKEEKKENVKGKAEDLFLTNNISRFDMGEDLH